MTSSILCEEDKTLHVNLSAEIKNRRRHSMGVKYLKRDSLKSISENSSRSRSRSRYGSFKGSPTKHSPISFSRTKTFQNPSEDKDMWRRAQESFSSQPAELDEFIKESSKYMLTRPDLMDDDLEIDYTRWKKRACCHQFSNPKLETYFWNFYMDYHTNTIRITFIAFIAFPILGWISIDSMQKGGSDEFYWILILRMVWCTVLLGFLIFFEIGIRHVGDFHEAQEEILYEVSFLKGQGVRSLKTTGTSTTWYKQLGALTVQYTCQFVFVVSLVSCFISLWISWIGKEPNHKPYIILFLVMHIFLGMGNNLCSFLCWVTTILYCVINFLLREGAYRTCAYVVTVSCILSVMGEFLEFSYRKLFYKRRELELEQFKNDLMLSTVVPPRIALQLKRGEREAVSYTYEEPNWGASVIFCQICDFEKLTNVLPASALVNYLNKVFTYMDKLSTQNNIYKVETVKEVYMAASGLPTPNANHMNQIAHFALDIKEFLIDMPERLALNDSKHNIPSPTLKIGIHCGTVIAGVIGKLCPRYRLFGDTVNVAARMETNSEKGKIQITERFKNRIDSTVFITVDRGFIKIKGKDSMRTYFLTGRNRNPNSGDSLKKISDPDDKGISILKFCFDNNKLDADPKPNVTTGLRLRRVSDFRSSYSLDTLKK